MRRLLVIALVDVVLLVGTGIPAAAMSSATSSADPGPMPVFAYFYQWYDTSSWDRAKIDYPLQGRYSSDDAQVLRGQVQTAKDAGITGFIVSWKSTEVNNRRLRNLVEVARAEDFHLAVIYQGLDFDRNPLPAQRVASDLRYFRDTFAADPVFRFRGRPMVIWSGTWRFSRPDLQAAVGPVRADVDVLASEKDTEGYERIADLFAGNAYYWSSVDPARYPGFWQRLQEMADAVHRRRGLWVAPFAPGFDARLVGGSRAVDRHEGATLYAEYQAAVASSPDVLGLISWNEFSENTHVEPSDRYGDRYVQLLRQLLDTSVAGAVGDAAQDSSDSTGAAAAGLPVGPVRVAVASAGALALLAAVTWRRRRRSPTRGRHARHRARRRTRRVRAVGTTSVVVMTMSTGCLGLPRPAPPTVAQTSLAPATSPTVFFQGAQPVRDPSRVVIAAAGDIACAADPVGIRSEERNSPVRCQSAATADLVSAIDPDAVLTLGDHQYPDGSLERFRSSYDHTWGRFRAITHPVLGNHEYGTPRAQGYFDYFGPAAGSPQAGYYSYDLGGWHVVALNSECRHVGCAAGSPQERWLRADLAAHPAQCTLAYWHQARFSTGTHGSVPDTAALWRALQDAGADLVLSGHDHDYERFAALDADGASSPSGIPSFVVGTGGDSYYRVHEPIAGREVALTSSPGVLQLTLTADGFEWAFRMVGPTPDGTVADSGATRCRAPGAPGPVASERPPDSAAATTEVIGAEGTT